MTIAAAALTARTSDKFMLIRLTPARMVSSSLTPSGGNYTMTFPYPVAKVTRNSTQLTKVDTLASNDQYTYDEAAQTLTVKVASAPNDATNTVVVYYHLFYTGTKPRQAYQTPDDSATTTREWQPRLETYPKVSQSIKNLLEGVFSVESTALNLINTDYAFQEYLTANDSFANKDVDIWQCVDTTDSILHVFSGQVTAVRLARDKVTIDIVDKFYKLRSSAFMGDALDEAYFTVGGANYPALYPPSQFKPCPYVVNKTTYKTSVNVSTVGTTPVNTNLAYLDYTTMLDAVCTDYSLSASSTTNRTWGLCRVPTGSLRALAFGTIASVVGQNTTQERIQYGPIDPSGGSTSFPILVMTTTADHNLKVGDSFEYSYLRSGSPENSYALVLEIDASNPAAPRILLMSSEDYAVYSTTKTLSSFTATSNSAPQILVYDPSHDYAYSLVYARDFTYSLISTQGGNSYLSVTFNNNMERQTLFGAYRYQPNLTYVTPTLHRVTFRVILSDSTFSHGTVISNLLTNAGLTVNSASITAANAALTAKASFTIPNVDETDYQPYLKYVQDILSSTLGYVRINTDQEAEYTLLAAPSSGYGLDDNFILKGSLDISVEYQDIVSDIVASNPHRIAPEDIATSTSSATSAKAKWLHGISKTDNFRHCLDDITTRLPYISLLRSARRASYSFDTANATLDALLGTDYTVTSPTVLGGGGVINLKVVTIDREGSKTHLEATDLQDL